MNPLAGWVNFYVIVGSSAGALIGLQFVVIALISEMGVVQGMERAGRAFSTPTIVHFAAVLLLGAIQSAPWNSIGPVAVLWGALGVSGVGYTASVIRHLRGQTAYKPEFEDWLCHALLPFAAYATLAISASIAHYFTRTALFAVATAALLLLFVGIHNAWDGVTYHVFVSRPARQERETQRSSPPLR